MSSVASTSATLAARVCVRTPARSAGTPTRCSAAPAAPAGTRRAVLLAGAAAVALSVRTPALASEYKIPQGLAGERVSVCDPGRPPRRHVPSFDVLAHAPTGGRRTTLCTCRGGMGIGRGLGPAPHTT
jgi:hypothetical protein